jgi:integrase
LGDRRGACGIGTYRPTKVKSQRDRVLTDEELAAIWATCRDNDYGRIVRLAVILGPRRAEIAGMCWSELDLETAIWTIPASRSKNHREHRVPLPDLALEIIRAVPRLVGRDFLFGRDEGRPIGGFSAAKKAIDERIAEAIGKPLKPWVLHDLRRTIDTGMGDKLGVLPHIADEVLGHVGAHKSGVQGTYNRALYEADVRKALTLWAEHVRSIVGGDGASKIAVLKRRA